MIGYTGGQAAVGVVNADSAVYVCQNQYNN